MKVRQMQSVMRSLLAIAESQFFAIAFPRAGCYAKLLTLLDVLLRATFPQLCVIEEAPVKFLLHCQIFQLHSLRVTIVMQILKVIIMYNHSAFSSRKFNLAQSLGISMVLSLYIFLLETEKSTRMTTNILYKSFVALLTA